MFGPFDQKTNVLFNDATDMLKTKFEFMKISNLERNLESHLESVMQESQMCSYARSLHKPSFTIFAAFLLLAFKFF